MAYLQYSFTNDKPLDCITIGRANVDCYPPEGNTLDEARLYHVYVGGSPANIAAGISKMGLKAGIITRVAKDKHGQFIHNYLATMFGIDTSHIQYDDSGAKTSLAFAECRPDADTIMYRNNVTDLWLSSDEIDASYIAKSKSVFISGTALTTDPSREAILTILKYAQESNVLCAMDIDYRPYGWESMQEASKVMSKAASMCHIIIGTKKEFQIAGASQTMSDKESAECFFNKGSLLVILKKGEKGSLCMYKNENEEHKFCQGTTYTVQVKKPYGAGDAFASTLISLLIKKKSIEHAMKYAAASASINISGVSCTEAMPTEKEIEMFIKEQESSS